MAAKKRTSSPKKKRASSPKKSPRGYDSMTVKELQKKAKGKGMKGYSLLNKKQLVRALRK